MILLSASSPFFSMTQITPHRGTPRGFSQRHVQRMMEDGRFSKDSPEGDKDHRRSITSPSDGGREQPAPNIWTVGKGLSSSIEIPELTPLKLQIVGMF